MVKFLSALFKRPTAKGLEQYDDEYVSYCIEQEQTVSELESALHASDNPNDIALQTLKTVCTFYDADWAGLLELDLELGVTTTGWQYHAESKPVMPHKMQEFENIYPMKTWLNALKSGVQPGLHRIDEDLAERPQKRRTNHHTGFTLYSKSVAAGISSI